MMIEVDFVREEIVVPSIARFNNDPNEISLAAAAIWALDSYASHVAFYLSTGAESTKDVELEFKKKLIESKHLYSPMFRVLRETSNALKHGNRKSSYLVSNSALISRNVQRGGWASYFANDEYWEDQVVIDLNLEFDSIKNCWLFNNEEFAPHWPFFKQVPVLSILLPSLELIDNALHSRTSSSPA